MRGRGARRELDDELLQPATQSVMRCATRTKCLEGRHAPSAGYAAACAAPACHSAQDQRQRADRAGAHVSPAKAAPSPPPPTVHVA